MTQVPTAGGGSDGDDGSCIVAGCDSTESSQCVGRAGWHATWRFIDGSTEAELVVVVAGSSPRVVVAMGRL